MSPLLRFALGLSLALLSAALMAVGFITLLFLAHTLQLGGVAIALGMLVLLWLMAQLVLGDLPDRAPDPAPQPLRAPG